MALDHIRKGMEEEAQYFTSCLNDSIGFDDSKADYKRYKGVAAIRNAFCRGQPISVVVIVGKENVVWAILQNAREMVPITVDASEPVETIIGLSYYAMAIQPSSMPLVHRASEDVISRYCILLPRISKEGLVTQTDGDLQSCITRQYAVIDSRWNYYHGERHGFQKPLVNIS
jgi:hypothetical protein